MLSGLHGSKSLAINIQSYKWMVKISKVQRVVGAYANMESHMRNFCHFCFLLTLLGLQPFLHQEVLRAVCEQALGPVSPSDSGRAG